MEADAFSILFYGHGGDDRTPATRGGIGGRIVERLDFSCDEATVVMNLFTANENERTQLLGTAARAQIESTEIRCIDEVLK